MRKKLVKYNGKLPEYNNCEVVRAYLSERLYRERTFLRMHQEAVYHMRAESDIGYRSVLGLVGKRVC
jgi:hypothetical protein